MAKRSWIGAACLGLMVGGCGSNTASENAVTSTAENLSTSEATVSQSAAATPSPAAAIQPPSFDCAKAQSDAEKMVCTDGDLAALDREVTRLYQLAAKDPSIAAARINELKATQRGWVKGRDDCWKADDKTACVETSYGSRILELRQGYKNARSKDDAGISTGPLALACGSTGYGVVFIRPEPSYAVIQSASNTIMLKAQPTGSGARYAGKAFDGDYALATKGDDAMLDLPGKPTATCRIEEIG